MNWFDVPIYSYACDLVIFVIKLSMRSASKEKSNENYWVTGLNASKLFCVVCKKPDNFPQVQDC